MCVPSLPFYEIYFSIASWFPLFLGMTDQNRHGIHRNAIMQIYWKRRMNLGNGNGICLLMGRGRLVRRLLLGGSMRLLGLRSGFIGLFSDQSFNFNDEIGGVSEEFVN